MLNLRCTTTKAYDPEDKYLTTRRLHQAAIHVDTCRDLDLSIHIAQSGKGLLPISPLKGNLGDSASVTAAKASQWLILNRKFCDAFHDKTL